MNSDRGRRPYHQSSGSGQQFPQQGQKSYSRSHEKHPYGSKGHSASADREQTSSESVADVMFAAAMAAGIGRCAVGVGARTKKVAGLEQMTMTQPQQPGRSCGGGGSDSSC